MRYREEPMGLTIVRQVGRMMPLVIGFCASQLIWDGLGWNAIIPVGIAAGIGLLAVWLYALTAQV